MNVKNISELVGKPIVTQDGREIGEIDTLYVDVDRWSVPKIGVKVRKDVLEDLKLKRPFIGTQAIQIFTEQVSGVTDTVVLKSDLSQLTFDGGDSEDLEKSTSDGA